MIEIFAPWDLGLGDDAEVDEAVDEVLYGQRDEQEAHDADEDADAGLAKHARHAVAHCRGRGSRRGP